MLLMDMVNVNVRMMLPGRCVVFKKVLHVLLMYWNTLNDLQKRDHRPPVNILGDDLKQGSPDYVLKTRST